MRRVRGALARYAESYPEMPEPHAEGTAIRHRPDPEAGAVPVHGGLRGDVPAAGLECRPHHT